MKIKREQVLLSLTEFVAGGSGLIIGIPGVGKSYLLSELVIKQAYSNIPACMLKLDNLMDGTDEEIANNFGMPDSKWIDHLKAIPLPKEGRPIIVFDAFDTLRDEKLKNNILAKIADVKMALPGWSVIVSVRTYDAQYSQRLMEMFPNEIGSNNTSGGRKYTITELSDVELKSFLSGQDRLQLLYNIANDRLREIFKIPFFIRLLNSSLAVDTIQLEHLSIIKSEIELLDRFWNSVLAKMNLALPTEVALKRLTSEMVKLKKLSVDKYDFLEQLSQDQILIVDRLLSENVLKEQGVTKGQLSFAHNILFDYAVSKIIIKDSSSDIVAFIAEDSTRPLFLRPSFIYFFSRLWYSHRDTFWSIYNGLSNNSNKEIRLFNKLIPSAVVVREFESAADIIWADENTEKHKREIGDILQGFRYLNTRASKYEVSLLIEILSNHIELEFIGDFCALLNTTLEDKEVISDKKSFESCGLASRKLFDYCFNHTDDTNVNLGNVIAFHAIPHVAKTYSSDSIESRTRLSKILQSLNATDFNISYISNLVNQILYIYRHDPAFIVDIYKAVFNHQETEDVATTMHKSVLLNLTSNRRDQFGLCYYSLKEFFSTFLNAWPEYAVPLSLYLCDMFILRRNKDEIIISDEYAIPSEMNINGIKANYHVDMSHFWAAYLNQNEEFEILKSVFEYFSQLAFQKNYERLYQLINLYIRHVKYAYEWGTLLDWAADHAEIMYDHLFGLLVQPAILYWSDTIQQAGNFLEKCQQWLTNDQLKQIENVISGLPDYAPKEQRQLVEEKTLRLLSRISKDKLQTERAQNIFEGRDPVPNDPLNTFTVISEPYTQRQFFRDNGIEINNPLIDELLTVQEELNDFIEGNSYNLPDEDNYMQWLQTAIETYDKVIAHPTLDERVTSTSLTSIANTCALILKSDSLAKEVGSIRKTNYEKIQVIILDCLFRHTASDTHSEQNYSPGSIFNHTPRSAAAAGLIPLYYLTAEKTLLPIIKQYSTDKNPIARFFLLQTVGVLYNIAQKLFWELILERLENEQDNVIWSEVMLKLDRKEIFETEQIKLISAFEVAQQRAKAAGDGSKIFDNFLLLTLSFFRKTENTQVKALLVDCIEENILIIQPLIWTVFKIIEPENYARNLKDENDVLQSERLINFLLQVLNGCEDTIATASEAQQPDPKIEECFRIINQTIMRIYFSLQVNDGLIKQQRNRLEIDKEQQAAFYWMVKPLLDNVVRIAESASFMQPHTAHYFIQILTLTVDFDPDYAISCVRKITEKTIGTGYIHDHSGIQEAVKFTQKLLGDHKILLADPRTFADIKAVLELYATAGWTEALNLLWQLDEVFR